MSQKNIWTAAIQADGSLAEPQLIINDLPDGGQHRARTIAVGPDNRLYVGVGSTGNACVETNPQNATMQRANFDGSDCYRASLCTTILHVRTREEAPACNQSVIGAADVLVSVRPPHASALSSPGLPIEAVRQRGSTWR